MEVEQMLEWKKAQSISISVDLESAAKKQLEFLAAVDRNRWLYESPGLDRAIYRYKACWIPLLAKHTEAEFFNGPLVIPFDCEWIWHCHRLNPVRYKSDCEEFYGRILDNVKVISSLEGISNRETEEVWEMFCPDEPYELDNTTLVDNANGGEGLVHFTKYDLILAVQRQSPFCYQVSRPHMSNHRYIKEAVARYKGFLYLIKRNQERSIKSFSVPTYDIDLIWHTHQLHSASYCKDLFGIMGKVLDHDDTDSDRTKGQKLDVGFSGTTKTFEEMYGCRYWRAGAMYRGTTPSPVRTTPYKVVTKNCIDSSDNQCINLPKIKELEVMLEFVAVRNLPEGHTGGLFVSFSKTQPDAIFNAKRELTILSESGTKQVATFRCQPTGDLLFELLCCLPSSLLVSKSSKSMGITSISLEDLSSPDSNFTVEKWLDLESGSNLMASKPIGLRVAVSVTVPTPVPYALHMISSRPFSKGFCLFPMPVSAKFAKSWTRVIDETGKSVLNLRMRNLKRSKEYKRSLVVGGTHLGETCTLAEFAESEWSLLNSPFTLKLPDSSNDDGHLLELMGPHIVRFYPGGRLDYESKCCAKHANKRETERHQITAVEFSAEDPYGRAVALADMKSGTVKIKEEWLLWPCFIAVFILSNTPRKEERSYG